MKELLLTILATTISIVLTFGTASFIEQHQANKVQRLMAMTIINDIDQNLNMVKNYIETEENGRNITIYLMENIDRLDSIPQDTLEGFFNYVTPFKFNLDMEFMKTNEEIFSSSQDSWRTLSDRTFFRNVQEFYNYRAVLERQRKESVAFQKPVTKEELYQMMMDSDEMSSRNGYVETCRKLLKSERVKRYTDFYAQRINDYEYFLMYFFNKNEENKFLMNITEQEMKDFINQTYRTVRPVKEKELVGIWDASYSNDNYKATFEYKKDHTFIAHYALYWSDAAIMGKMIQRYSIAGNWAIEGDSLVKVFDLKSYKMEIDESGATSYPNQAGAVAELKKRLSEMPESMKLLKKEPRVSQATNIDESGTRLQLDEPGWSTTHFRKIRNTPVRDKKN